jgi:hypothetical protein
MMSEVNPKTGRLIEEDFVKACIAHGMKGNASINKEIWNRLDGKVPDDIDLTVRNPFDEKVKDMDGERLEKEIKIVEAKLKKLKKNGRK